MKKHSGATSASIPFNNAKIGRFSYCKTINKGGDIILILLPVLLCCIWYDSRHHRIPNWCLGIGFILCAAAFMRRSPDDLFVCIVKAMGSMILLLPVYSIGAFGAGDLKLISLILAAFDLKRGICVVFLGCFLGAILSLFKLVRSGSLFYRLKLFISYLTRSLNQNRWELYYDVKKEGYQMTIPLGACLSVAAAADLIIHWGGDFL